MIIGYPEKILYRWYSSNIRLITGASLELRCYTNINARLYKNSWKKVRNIGILKRSNCINFEIMLSLEWRTFNIGR